jgi:hypothetical protein
MGAGLSVGSYGFYRDGLGPSVSADEERLAFRGEVSLGGRAVSSGRIHAPLQTKPVRVRSHAPCLGPERTARGLEASGRRLLFIAPTVTAATPGENLEPLKLLHILSSSRMLCDRHMTKPSWA